MPSDVAVFVLGAVGSQSIMIASDLTSQFIEHTHGLETVRDRTPGCTPQPSPKLQPVDGAPLQPPIEPPPKPCTLNWRRLGRFTLVTTITGFAFQGWWYYMDHAVPGSTWHPVLMKTLYTQGFDVLIIPCEQAALAYLNPKVTVWDKLRREFVPMQLFALAFLPACHVAMFLWVPLPWQIWASRLNGYVCGVTLSFFSYRAMPDDDGGCYVPCCGGSAKTVDEFGDELRNDDGVADLPEAVEEEEAPPLPSQRQRDRCEACCLVQ
eukprot:TRINITY_DN11644_c0_g1_i1.p1 TRINITY_DN11644_c0_g1~~TRINITY_DN11644_c0_g1_i1.p1  ORF type:complete len:265 (+),score=59.80 TRINITY_DN11644_c0_g1_i1:265-1059(+)